MSEYRKECDVEPLEKSLDREALADAMVVYLEVWGMGCPRCAIRVNNGLLQVDGVLWSKVYLDQSVATVLCDQERITHEALVQAVVQAGNDGRHDYRAAVIGQKPARSPGQVMS